MLSSFICALIVEAGSIAFFLMWRNVIDQISDKKALPSVVFPVSLPLWIQRLLFLRSGVYQISFFVLVFALLSELFAITTSIAFIVFFISDAFFWKYVAYYGITAAVTSILNIALLVVFVLRKNRKK